MRRRLAALLRRWAERMDPHRPETPRPWTERTLDGAEVHDLPQHTPVHNEPRPSAWLPEDEDAEKPQPVRFGGNYL